MELVLILPFGGLEGISKDGNSFIYEIKLLSNHLRFMCNLLRLILRPML
mgnify:FL=1